MLVRFRSSQASPAATASSSLSSHRHLFPQIRTAQLSPFSAPSAGTGLQAYSLLFPRFRSSQLKPTGIVPPEPPPVGTYGGGLFHGIEFTNIKTLRDERDLIDIIEIVVIAMNGRW